MSRAAGRWWLALVLLAAVGACTKVGSDVNAPVAIELDPPVLPSIVLGDSLRDTLGMVDSLHGTAFNFRNDPIAGAPVHYLVIGTPGKIGLDTASGRIAALDTGSTRVVATIGGLQSDPITITVVERPDTVFGVTPLVDSITYTNLLRDTLKALSVQLQSAGTGVPSYRIEYRVAYPPGLDNVDSTHVLVVDDARKPSLVDTTDATGTATRSLRITPFAHTFSDTVVVEAAAYEPDRTPVHGSPVRFTIKVTIP